MEKGVLSILRPITVFNTVGSGKNVIETSATTFGELQYDLNSKGIRYKGLKAVIGENQNTLESPNALLPTTPFTLFLLPEKVKSGARGVTLEDVIKATKWKKGPEATAARLGISVKEYLALREKIKKGAVVSTPNKPVKSAPAPVKQTTQPKVVKRAASLLSGSKPARVSNDLSSEKKSALSEHVDSLLTICSKIKEILGTDSKSLPVETKQDRPEPTENKFVEKTSTQLEAEAYNLRRSLGL